MSYIKLLMRNLVMMVHISCDRGNISLRLALNLPPYWIGFLYQGLIRQGRFPLWRNSLKNHYRL